MPKDPSFYNMFPQTNEPVLLQLFLSVVCDANTMLVTNLCLLQCIIYLLVLTSFFLFQGSYNPHCRGNYAAHTNCGSWDGDFVMIMGEFELSRAM